MLNDYHYLLIISLIKMSSPNINNIINSCCILLYMCPILNSIKGLNTHNEVLANLMCQVCVLLNYFHFHRFKNVI
jgi:hypothetical protein